VVLVRGNHDWNISFYAYRYAYAWFRFNENVHVHRDSKARVYLELGKTMLLLTHIDNPRLFEALPYEARQMWGRTGYAEIIVAHGHHEDIKEKIGIKRRMLPGMTPPDEYEYRLVFDALSVSQGLIYNDNQRGVYIILNATTDMLPEEVLSDD